MKITDTDMPAFNKAVLLGGFLDLLEDSGGTDIVLDFRFLEGGKSFSMFGL